MKVTLKWIAVCRAEQLRDREEELKGKGGIYIWIWRGNPRRIVYIGETDDFISRNAAHFRNVLGGLGTYFRNITDNDDYVELVRKHYAGKTWEELKSSSMVYVPEHPKELKLSESLPSKDELMKRWRYLDGMDYAFAEIAPQLDRGARREIEGGLIHDIWAHYCELAYG